MTGRCAQTDRQTHTHIERTHYLRHSLRSLGGDNKKNFLKPKTWNLRHSDDQTQVGYSNTHAALETEMTGLPSNCKYCLVKCVECGMTCCPATWRAAVKCSLSGVWQHGQMEENELERTVGGYDESVPSDENEMLVLASEPGRLTASSLTISSS